ncbi:alcohol dehydrogenase transcription factor Myb/SANT-like family protein [Actinidia rufa]|uniref:Alcohol dehydrogenase transcription factor Myb/SANT-like family protein n=1 Tax=Actinidia rufa TaxID=165716 RepID=A0A7J0FI10_9ERIC|nr:alcohol dehydrogenase transcription factor Myb/SANT-like family protein [Actinidia rufa]
MDDSEEDDRYRSAYNSSTRLKHSNRNRSYPINSNDRDDSDEEEYEDDEFGEEDEGINHEFNDQEDDEDEEDVENGYDESKRRQKKRRLGSLVSNYEFVPRNPPRGPQNSPSDWTDQVTFALLEVWGDRFLQLGRKSLRSEDWQEVAEKVSEGLKAEWTDTQCRNRLDTLKKKYKKEKSKMEAMAGYNSKWVFFKKMEMLLNWSNSLARQQCGLPCGIDSGEYVFMNTRVYLDRSNGLDEMRDSPGESESYEDDDEDSDGLPPKKRGVGGEENDGSFGLLADSIHKFGDIYEKIESSKRQQMMELVKMRMDFQRDLEVQKKQILDRAQAEIVKIRQGDDDETDGSAENFSG